ncbi:DDE-type integrase/transposase/recombinase [Mesorhizobium sp. DCY119]|uniref:DDE-type integrase/transposase/recombinase n=1 Tax=Mesorhizobium sp. DCY119 TaxID=2108445 RepID=UPI000E6BDCD1|nr:DDE-type integrase/transposase/recombinase [Mesorhizobium sp. DCY119]RJG47369.1 transposase [Mesorhizobium sp. DCY119]
MKVWFTAAEFADLAATGELPGLPATKRGMNALIARENWASHAGLCRPRAGRAGGGGDEFHIDLLPLSTRIAYAGRHCRVEPADLRPSLCEDDRLTARARTERDARLVLLNLADRFRREQNLSIVAADTLFAGVYNSRSIDVPAWVREQIRQASARSLARWRSTRDGSGSNALGHDPATARKGTSQLDRALDGRVRTFALAAIAKMPFLSTKRALELVTDKFGDEFRAPPIRTFQRQLALWKEEYCNELQLLTDPDGYRSKTEFALVNAARASRINECWQIDASPADVMLKEGRHSIYLAIDVLTRRTKVLATRTPRASGVGLLTRKAILAWGVPEKIKIDNGSDFAATATQRLFAALGIEVEFSAPYSPKQKGMVERAIGTFQRDLAGLPGFVGHSVADRKIIEGRKAFAQRLGADPSELFGVDMDLAAFQAWCDDWTDKIYASTPHEGLGRRTPFEVAASFAGSIRRLDNVAALDILLAPVPGKDGLRTVTKTGIRIDGAHYLTGSVMPGETVFCRMDPADLGRVLLFEADGETYLGEAVCPELGGLDPVETIAKVKAAQKAHVDGRIKDIRREMRRIGPRAVVDAMRNQAEKRAGNLLAFPQRAEIHTTPALGAAASASAPAQPNALSDRAAEIHAQMRDEATAAEPIPSSSNMSTAAVTRLPETREQRFRRALDLEQRRNRGERLRDDDLLWLGAYQTGSEYRAMRAMFDEFGAEAMRL